MGTQQPRLFSAGLISPLSARAKRPIIGEKMNEEFSYVWLLPLLEKPFETAALDLPDAASALSKNIRYLPTLRCSRW